MVRCSDESIIICGIVRDAERGLTRNIPIINELCGYFKDYRVVVYENDSKDATKKLLRQWKSRDGQRIHICMEDTDSSSTIPDAGSVNANPFFCKKRITKMANLRNKYMEYIDAQKWDADYLIVVDLDVARLDLDAILSSFKNGAEWDAVTAFGYSLSPKMSLRYHDTYALTRWGDENNPQTEEKIKRLADEYGRLKTSDEWVRVYSAFGGLAIYKFEAVKGLRYKALPNDDSRVEMKCEHFSIYKQMQERGYDKFYVNPQMKLKYQALTFKIVFNSLMRRLK